MELSKLYDLIEKGTINKWREEVDEEDDCLFKRDLEECRKELSGKLSEELMKEVEHYRRANDNYLDYIYYNVKIKCLNLGIKIGMELQKSFSEMEEE